MVDRTTLKFGPDGANMLSLLATQGVRLTNKDCREILTEMRESLGNFTRGSAATKFEFKGVSSRFVRGKKFDVDLSWSNSQSRIPVIVLSERSPAPPVPKKRVRHSQPEPNCLTTRLAMIGPSESGKSVLLHALFSKVIKQPLPLGFSFSSGDPRATVNKMLEHRRVREAITSGALMSTQSFEPLEFYLQKNVHPQVQCQFHEVVGQVLTQPDQYADEFRFFEKTVTNADVLWVVIPAYPKNPTPADVGRFEESVLLARAYITHAIQNRETDRVCSVGIVLTKVDRLIESEEALENTPDSEFIELLGQVVDMVKQEKRIRYSAIFPVSSMGFGKTRELKRSRRAASRNSWSDGSVYVLDETEDIAPFNVQPLVVWSLLCGALHQTFRINSKTKSFPSDWKAMMSSFTDLEKRYIAIDPLPQYGNVHGQK